MAIKEIVVNNYSYKVQCTDGEEQHLDFLAVNLDRRVKEISSSLNGKVNDSVLLLLAALELEDAQISLAQNLSELTSTHAENTMNLSRKLGVLIEKIKKAC